ncbi:MAG: glycosyltransferase family 8 protein [Candidatus Saccharibacteria bacterium]|nr:glycosyltransferase family 8 protein [Candidatus Saccharibacteria bacterium]
MNVVYASDDNFAEILGVSMLSLFENNKESQTIVVYILDSGIKDENKLRLNQLASRYGGNLTFVSTDEVVTLLNGIKQDRGGASQFARLFLSRLLPESCDRVLYLDCDTIVRHSLEDFYKIDFEGNVVCGVMDCISKQHRARLGLKPDDIYINSGMMLVDFQAWLANGIEEKVEKVIADFNGIVPYADQGIINLALHKLIKCVHPRYNCISVYTAFDFNDLLAFRQPSACPSSLEIEEAQSNPTIAHFVTLFCMSRPWNKDSKGPFFDEWRMYKKMSPWADFPERIRFQSISRSICAVMYRTLPRFVSLMVLGFLHSRLKPLLGKLI